MVHEERVGERIRPAVADAGGSGARAALSGAHPDHHELLEAGLRRHHQDLHHGELLRLLREEDLLPDSLPFDSDLRPGDTGHHRAGLSARVLHRLPRAEEQDDVDHPGHDPLLDQLPPAGLRVEGDPRLQRRRQFRAHVPGGDIRSARIPALQPHRGGHHAGARLGGGGHPAHLRIAGEDRPLPHRGGARSGGERVHDLRARHPAAVPARGDRREPAGVHPHRRGLRDAGARGGGRAGS